MEWGKAYTWILDFRLENNDMKRYKATLIEKYDEMIKNTRLFQKKTGNKKFKKRKIWQLTG